MRRHACSHAAQEQLPLARDALRHLLALPCAVMHACMSLWHLVASCFLMLLHVCVCMCVYVCVCVRVCVARSGIFLTMPLERYCFRTFPGGGFSIVEMFGQVCVCVRNVWTGVCVRACVKFPACDNRAGTHTQHPTQTHTLPSSLRPHTNSTITHPPARPPSQTHTQSNILALVGGNPSPAGFSESTIVLWDDDQSVALWELQVTQPQPLNPKP